MKRPASIQHCFQLPFKGPPVLATGGRQRNTLCVTRGDKAFLSHSLGDLDSATACSDHEIATTEIMIWQAAIPAVIARDLDPDIHSTRFAIELAGNLGVPNLAVQHHHAHVAAVCAEHGIMEPVVGLVLDDCGLGSDGACWGGELLWTDSDKFERLGHLAQLAKPGGDIAQRETWRMAAGVLHRLQRQDEVVRRYTDHPASLDLMTMLAEGRNCPPTSCASLLIATVADLLRLPTQGNGHNDASSVLQAAALEYFNGDYAPVAESLWEINAQGELDFYPLLANLVDEPDARRGAATFHANLIAGATEWVVGACHARGTQAVVLAGACLLNRLLATGLRDNLEGRELEVFEVDQILPDDSSLALGQAWIALKSLRH